ncbi:MAG: hypothetical protein ABJL99_24095 [Aliishimia sp.]
MKDAAFPPQVPLRPPSEVMRLRRMGAMFPTRLSFLRILTRRLSEQGTQPRRTVWEMDTDGYGRAVFTLDYFGHTYSLVALSQPLDEKDRSDRVIATAWDAAFVLYDGVPDTAELDRIAAAAPLQEAGRYTEKDLVLSRANKSVRLWSHCVERLRNGEQPDPHVLNPIGYLMRTTAVYGNGKFGIADRALLEDRPGLEVSFMIEMLTVWLIRNFTFALIEHVGGHTIERDLKRQLGIGNATGLGMAPFLVTHPVLLNNWMMVRETALARVRAQPHLTDAQQSRLRDLHARAVDHLSQWQVPEAAHQLRIDQMCAEWAHLTPALQDLTASDALEHLWQHGQSYSIETQELLLSLMLEPFPELIDGLAECLTDPFGAGALSFADTAALQAVLTRDYDWALALDFDDPQQCQRFWYVSEEKLEPRLGDRVQDLGADRESPLDIARQIKALHADLPDVPEPLTTFLTRHPQHLLAAERAQIMTTHPYAEIRDNLIADTCLPIDMLRAKLACFGATRFDPKSDLWTRITLAQGAPLADELGMQHADDWWCPAMPT